MLPILPPSFHNEIPIATNHVRWTFNLETPYSNYYSLEYPANTERNCISIYEENIRKLEHAH